MRDDDKIDFSSLDPMCDRVRFEGMVQTIVERASAKTDALSDEPSIASQLATWARPALALAAGLTVLVWAGALFSKPTASQTTQPAWALSTWAFNDQVPAANEILEVMSDDTVTN
jgi:hypothetical protein